MNKYKINVEMGDGADSWSSNGSTRSMEGSKSSDLSFDLDKVAEVGKKVCLKVGMNAAVPGSGSLLDIKDAAQHFQEGHTSSGFISLGFAALDIASMGVFGVAREAAVASGRIAAQSATREAIKTCPEDVAKEAMESLGQDLAKDMVETLVQESVEETSKVTAKSAVEALAKTAVASGGTDVAERLCASSLGLALRKTIEIVRSDCGKKTFTSNAATAVRNISNDIISSAKRVNTITSGTMATVAGLARYNTRRQPLSDNAGYQLTVEEEQEKSNSGKPHDQTAPEDPPVMNK